MRWALRTPHTAATLLLLSLVVACCAPKLPSLPALVDGKPSPRPLERRGSEVLVGVARADITTPPGASTFGHALDARVTEGYWTRTYCRVFYFENRDGKRLLIVPCDLPAMSMLLRQQVLANLEGAIFPAELMMTATHSHAGSAHYHGNAQYTGMLSSRLPGYSHELMQAMAGRISAAVARAIRDKRPALLSWRHESDFWGFTRNRSMDAYRGNREPFAAVPPTHSRGRPVPNRPDLHAIDPNMHVLALDAIDPDTGRVQGPLGSLSFFAMHPTVLRSSNRLLGGDTSAVISRFVERRLRQRWAELGPLPDPAQLDPLHGVVNTNEGDISAVAMRGDLEETIALGEAIGQFIWDSHPAPGSGLAKPILDSRYLEERAPGASFEDEGKRYALCDEPRLGQGMARGATDHPTSVAPLKPFGTSPPVDYESDDCHAPKRPLLGIISSFASQFPKTLPLASAQIGDTLISFVPAELTITAGHQLNQRALAAVQGYPDAPKVALVAGLANEYIQYVATEDEYQQQAYEGASTIYGPDSARYLSVRAASLAKAMFETDARDAMPKLDVGAPGRFSLGPLVDVHDAATGHGPFEVIHTCTIAVDRAVRTDDTTPLPDAGSGTPHLCMYWMDREPKRVPLQPAEQTNAPLGPTWVRLFTDDPQPAPVRVCAENERGTCDPAGFVDDRGVHFQTRIHSRVHGRWVWSTRFSPAAQLWRELGRTPSRIHVGDGLVSAPFSASSLPEPCSTEQARICTGDARVAEWHNLLPECAPSATERDGRFRVRERANARRSCVTP